MHSKSVLLVDDEQPVLLSLGSYLEDRAFRVATAESGETALARFRSTDFDLVITDVAMGGISGIEVLQEIKRDNLEAGVFILTGRGEMQLVIEALRSGADDFICKPCDADLLILKMERFFLKQEAFRKVKIYEKFLPICMYCKKIRDDGGRRPGTGRWLEIEDYLCQKSGTLLTHGCCPDCFRTLSVRDQADNML